MSAPAPESHFHLAWWIWMIAQVGVIALFAHRVPLSANYPEPIEATADLGLLFVQLALATLLSPMLLSRARHLAIVVLCAGPMVLIAGLLAGRSIGWILPIALVDFLWLAVFAMYRDGLARAVMVMLVIGGPVLRYLVADFGTGTPPPEWAWAIAPLLSIAAVRNGTLPLYLCLSPPLAVLVIGGTVYCKRSKPSEIVIPEQT